MLEWLPQLLLLLLDVLFTGHFSYPWMIVQAQEIFSPECRKICAIKNNASFKTDFHLNCVVGYQTVTCSEQMLLWGV